MIDHESWHDQPFGEIVLDDTYRLKSIPAPSTVYDLGGNRGCFAAYCKHLWPTCRVISVEPNADNCRLFRESTATLHDVTLVEAAIANGPVWFLSGPSHGGHTYTSTTVGHSADALQRRVHAPCDVPAISLSGLASRHQPKGRYVVKMDIEGGEQCLIDDEPSNAFLRGAAYFAAELHFFAAEAREVPNGPKLPSLMGTHGHVITKMLEWCYGFTETHNVDLQLLPNSGMLWAKRRT